MRIATHWALAALLSWPLSAAGAPASTATIDDLMHRSGLWQQLAGIAGTFQKGVDLALEQKTLPDAATAARIREVFGTAYGADRLRPAVARGLSETLSAEDAEAALAWLNTDLGKRITTLEEQASEDTPPDRAAEIGAALAPGRRALIERLLKALHAGDVLATVLINMTYGLARGVELASPSGRTGQADAVRSMLESGRAQLAARAERELLGSNAVTYGPLTDAELERYVVFAESPAGGRYHAASSIALEQALSAASIEAGRMFASSRAT